MILTRIHPKPAPSIDLADADSRDRLAELYRPLREDWLRLNLVGSASGSAAGNDGTSDSLTNRADRALLGVIRRLSDAVIVGAASVRAEGYYVPRTAALAIVTGSGDFSGHRIVAGSDRGPLLVLCPASAVERAVHDLAGIPAEVIAVPDVNGVLAAPDIVAALRQRGYRSLVCEGGPQLAAHLVRGGVVDEACLTTSPVLNGAALPLFGSEPFAQKRLTLTQLMVDDADALYARWSLAGA